MATRTPTRLLRVSEVERKVALHRATIYRRIVAGDFPQPLKLSGGTVRWVDAEVEAWIERQVNERDRRNSASGA